MRWLFLIGMLLTACGGTNLDASDSSEQEIQLASEPPLYPGETDELRVLINRYADFYEVPRPLVHKVVQRESDYRPKALNRPYYGLMQILPATARSMGFEGKPMDLLDAETNLKYAVRYLRGAWLVSDGDQDRAVQWYARGYYFEARDRCLLVETGLNTRELGKGCK